MAAAFVVAMPACTEDNDKSTTAHAIIIDGGEATFELAEMGVKVLLIPNIPEGQVFVRWKVKEGGAVLAKLNQQELETLTPEEEGANYKFMMPGWDVEIEAIYGYVISVEGGRSDLPNIVPGGEESEYEYQAVAAPGDKITMTPDALPVEQLNTMEFITWTNSVEGGIDFQWGTNSRGQSIQTFIMPEEDVLLIADIQPIDVFRRISDPVFLDYCSTFDSNRDGKLSTDEANRVTAIDVSDSGIQSLAGLEMFRELVTLDCSNNSLTSIDLTRNAKLQTLICNNNYLSRLDLGLNVELVTVDCSNNRLDDTTITMDLSKNTKIENFNCANNRLHTLNLSSSPELKILNCQNNLLGQVNVNGCTKLTDINCVNNQIVNFSVNTNTALVNLFCGNNNIAALDVSRNVNLVDLRCYTNSIATLNTTGAVALKNLACNGNVITALDLTTNVALESLLCNANRIETTIDLSANVNLKALYCTENLITELDLTTNTKLAVVNHDDGVVVTGWSE